MYRDDSKIMCTARYCPYANSCYRHTRGDPDDIEISYVDFQLGGCDAVNGFSSYKSYIITNTERMSK